MFIGRESELAKLNALYEKKCFQLPIIYGRRRVGKTALINEFIKDKRAISFTGIESNTKQNLEGFSQSIFTFESGIQNAPVFKNFFEALEYVFLLSVNKRLVLVIDEYPYVAGADKSLSSVLQNLIDRYKDSSLLFLILCGSSMSFMEEQVLGYSSPLYGRRTAQFKILPFTFKESCCYFKNFSRHDMVYIYGIVGGTPQYLLQIDDNLSVEENIKQKILDKNCYLYEEPNNLLKQEVREAALYNAVIAAVATGSTKLAEISAKVGAPTSAGSACLKKLISLGIIKKEMPLNEKSTKKTLYSVEDNLFRFWYRFVAANMSLLQNEMTEVAYKNINGQLNAFIGGVFEEICKQELWQQNRAGQLPFVFSQLGRWWGTNPKQKKQTEIDIMGIGEKSSALFCECKWTNEKVDLSVLNKLIDLSSLFHYNNVFFYVFSKTGFTATCEDTAKKLSNVKLVSFESL